MSFPSIMVNLWSPAHYTPPDLEIKEITETSTSASYLGLLLSVIEGTLHWQNYTWVSSLWCLHLANNKIRHSLLFVWWFDIQREATHEKALTLKKWRSTFKSFMVDTMIWNNITIFLLHSFGVTLFSVDVCYIHRIWSHWIWLIILLIPRRLLAWPHHVKFTLSRYVSTSLGFPRVCVVLSVTFIPGLVPWIWTNGVLLTGGNGLLL